MLKLNVTVIDVIKNNNVENRNVEFACILIYINEEWNILFIGFIR